MKKITSRQIISISVAFTVIAGLITFMTFGKTQEPDGCSPSDIQHLEQQKAVSERERAPLQASMDSLDFELFMYIIQDHKLATAGVVALGMKGADLIIGDESDIPQEYRDILTALAVAGGLYCLANAGECLDVSNTLLAWGAERSVLEEKIASLDSSIQSSSQALASCRDMSARR